MSDAWQLGKMGTDTLTGRSPRVMPTIRATLDTGVGMNFKHAGANYVVTAGKTFYLTGVQINANDYYTATSYYEIRYADNAALTTNPVTMIGLPSPAAAWQSPVLPIVGVSAPAGKYVGIFNNSGVNQANCTGGVTAYGYEA